PRPLRVLAEPRDVEALGIRDAAPRVRHGDDLPTALVQEARDPRAHVAEPLYRERPAAHLAEAGAAQVLLEGEHGAAPRRLLAPLRAEEVHGLAGHDGRREAVDLRVLVHD